MLMGTILRLGDVDVRPEESVEVAIKTSKCTALSRPKGWKKFARRQSEEEDNAAMDEGDGEPGENVVFSQLKMRTEYYIDRNEGQDGASDSGSVDGDGDQSMRDGRKNEEMYEKVEKEQLVRGFKYGTTYAPCPDGEFPRLNTKKGIDICGFFQAKNVRVISFGTPSCLITNPVPSRALPWGNTIYLGRSFPALTPSCLVLNRASYVREKRDGNSKVGEQGRHGPKNGRPGSQRL
jgi:hypothetical protein